MVLIAAALWASAASAAPLEVYGRLPNIEAAAVSPGGEMLGVISTDGEQRKIVIQRLSDNKLIQVLNAGTTKVRDLAWAGPDHLIITTSKTSILENVEAPRDEYMMAFDFNLALGKIKPLLEDADGSLNVILDQPVIRTLKGKPTVFLQGIHFMPSGAGAPTVYRVELDTDRSKQAEDPSFYANDWLVGQDGEVVAQTQYQVKSGRWSLKLKAPGGAWRESRVMQFESGYPVLLGLGRDGRTALVQEYVEGGLALREVTPDGAWGEPLALQDDDTPIFDPERHNLIGYYALVGEEDRYTFFDPRDQQVWKVITSAYPGQRVHLVSWSGDRMKVVVLVDSPTEGPAYAVVNRTTHQAAWLGTVYDNLGADGVSPVRPIRFKARDGLEITGYLTIPRGAEAKNLPLVVFPHGGPAARDEPGFDWWAQAMASRGYAVLQVNFRGSDGFGPKFLQAGYGEWGRKMQTDLSDGVRFLAGEGSIDPKRACIVGASYGGYAALAGATLDADVYRCAVSVAGLSDLKKFVVWSKTNKGLGAQRYWIRFMGAENAKDPSMAEISPAEHADRVKAPILLIHGKDDTVVPLEQSRVMADALKAAGKRVDLVVLDSTDHWLTRGETRLAMLQTVMAFLEKNNPLH
jgi:dipeptidyl aminopeptidase/acylaminoacyl peptidase